jgi:hypothetical protein
MRSAKYWLFAITIHLVIILVLSGNNRKKKSPKINKEEDLIFEIIENRDTAAKSEIANNSSQKTNEMMKNKSNISSRNKTGNSSRDKRNSFIDDLKKDWHFTSDKNKYSSLNPMEPSSHNVKSVKSSSVYWQKQIKNLKKKGGISLNTYEWDYSPYLEYLQQLIQSNIHPPYAFTHMCIIDGEVILRFRILKNGKLAVLEILHKNTHNSLVTTSKTAVTSSAPFKTLPQSFPLSHLEVTALFSYINNKKRMKNE